jgi:hypothetical protein
MVTLKLEATEATPVGVCARLNLAEGELDRNFGVVLLDASRSLYAILVDESVAEKLEHAEGVEGTFSNPPIEPFGPPKG